MKVQLVSIRPTPAAEEAGRASLTPELLAATGARYSRSNDGLDVIISKIDPENLDKSVDGIFKMIDYGHQSIADMAPVSLFIDGISMWLAYLVWAQVPTAGGQESSTRYLEFTENELLSPEELGISAEHAEDWKAKMSRSLKHYNLMLNMWAKHGEANPNETRIPSELLNDPSSKAQKAVARMQRNYAFDRARYFLPVAMRTNMMLVMSARAWVQLSQWLLSHPLKEARTLGEKAVAELQLVTPRLHRHATEKPSFKSGHIDEFNQAHRIPVFGRAISAEPFLEVMTPAGLRPADYAQALRHHDNRYAYLGDALKRTAVRFGWEGIAFAEIRDLNRHRTGNKYCPQVPVGIYTALDQANMEIRLALKDPILDSVETMTAGLNLYDQNVHEHVYWYILGTEFYFEHTTTADKFIYEAELRTGTGAHYRYAKHLHDALELWYQRFPSTKGLVLEGSAEPE